MKLKYKVDKYIGTVQFELNNKVLDFFKLELNIDFEEFEKEKLNNGAHKYTFILFDGRKEINLRVPENIDETNPEKNRKLDLKEKSREQFKKDFKLPTESSFQNRYDLSLFLQGGSKYIYLARGHYLFLIFETSKTGEQKFNSLYLLNIPDRSYIKNTLESKFKLLSTVNKQTQKITASQDFLPEHYFWNYTQILEELLLAIEPESFSGQQERIKNNLLKHLGINYEDIYVGFENLIYNALGVVIGGFALANIANDEIIYIQNIDLQELFFNKKQDRASKYRATTPSLEIPYIFDKGNMSYSQEYRFLIDALFMNYRSQQRLQHGTPPEYYRRLPEYADFEKQWDHLEGKIKVKDVRLPLEKKLGASNFKFYYCSEGETLFFILAWLTLKRKIEHISSKKEHPFKALYSLHTITENISDKQFWTKVLTLYSDSPKDIKTEKIPEYNWVTFLDNEFNYFSTKNDNEKETIRTKEKHSVIIQEWEKVNAQYISSQEESGKPYFKYGFTYDLWNKLGLLEITADKKAKPTESLKKLIRFFIHILQNCSESFEEIDLYDLKNNKEFGGLDGLKNDLLKIEKLLDNTNSDFFELEQQFNIHKKLIYIISLFFGFRSKTFLRCFEILHYNAAFPVLPFFYELVAGENHIPKEYLVLNVWDSKGYRVELGKGYGENSAVLFSQFMLTPLWRIKKDSTLTKDKAPEYAPESEMSLGAYNRLFRIYNFFSLWCQPIIDQGFYKNIFPYKVRDEQKASFYSASSHELTKITKGIFETSQTTFSSLFNDPDVIKKIEQHLKIKKEDNINISDWKVIPVPELFRGLSNQLWIWADPGNLDMIFDFTEGQTNLKEFLNICYEEAKSTAIVNYRLQRTFSVQEKEDVIEYLELYRDARRSFPELNIIKPTNLLPKKVIWAKKGKKEKEIKRNTIKKTRATQLVICAFTNALKHIKEDANELNLSIRMESGNQLVFELDNEFDHYNFIPPNPGTEAKSLGTEPVMSFCSRELSIDYMSIKKEDQKFFYPNLKAKGIFTTKFIIPCSEIFTF